MAEHTPNPVPAPEDFRWQGLFQHCREPLFLLNRRRRVLFVNHAWEVLTGLHVSAVRGQVCKRLPAPEEAESWQVMLAALAPPAEVLEGRSASVRRRVTQKSRSGWWDIVFVPLRGDQEMLGILGKITVVSSQEGVFDQPLPDKIVNLRQRFVQQFDLSRLPSELPAMAKVREQARLAAQTRVPVLLVGPPGSGKHWLARAIHQSGMGRDRPFARLDAGKLSPRNLTQWLVHQLPRHALGTIYLKDLARLPREFQVALGHRLREGQAPRILAGLGSLDESEAILPELFCQLSTLNIVLPPLRERLPDLEGFIELFLKRGSEMNGSPLPSLSPDALHILRSHAWPGNLRELYQALLAAAARAKDGRIEAGDLPFHLHAASRPFELTLPLDSLLEQVEKRLILLAMRLTENNKTRAAEMLGIWRARLIRRLENLGLSGDESKSK